MYVGNETGNPMAPGPQGPPPMYPPPPVNYQQAPYPPQQGMAYGPTGYGQPVAQSQPNTVIIKEKVENSSGVAEGCCAGCCAACLAILCCCCMAAAASPGPRHHRGRR